MAKIKFNQYELGKQPEMNVLINGKNYGSFKELSSRCSLTVENQVELHFENENGKSKSIYLNLAGNQTYVFNPKAKSFVKEDVKSTVLEYITLVILISLTLFSIFTISTEHVAPHYVLLTGSIVFTINFILELLIANKNEKDAIFNVEFECLMYVPKRAKKNINRFNAPLKYIEALPLVMTFFMCVTILQIM